MTMTELREPAHRASRPRPALLDGAGAAGLDRGGRWSRRPCSPARAPPRAGDVTVVAAVTAALALAHLVVMPQWRYRVHRWEITDTAVYTRVRLVHPGAADRPDRAHPDRRHPARPVRAGLRAGQRHRHHRLGQGPDQDPRPGPSPSPTTPSPGSPSAPSSPAVTARDVPHARRPVATPPTRTTRRRPRGRRRGTGSARACCSSTRSIELGRALPALVGIFLAGSSQGNHCWGLGRAGVVAAFSLTRWFTTRLRITADHVQLRHGLLRRRDDHHRPQPHPHRRRHLARAAPRCSAWPAWSSAPAPTTARARAGSCSTGSPARRGAALRDDLLHRGAAGRGAEQRRGPAPARPSSSPASIGAGSATRRSRCPACSPGWSSGACTGGCRASRGSTWPTPARCARSSRWLERLPTGAAVLVGRRRASSPSSRSPRPPDTCSRSGTSGSCATPGGTLQVTRGLLTTRATSIERRRLVGVQLSEPLPLRWVGAARTTAVATGLRAGRGAERGGEVLLPPAPRGGGGAGRRGHPRRRRRAVTAAAAPAPATAAAAPHDPRARSARSAIAAARAVVAWRAGGAGVGPARSAAPALLAAVPLGLDRYRNLGHALVDGRLVTVRTARWCAPRHRARHRRGDRLDAAHAPSSSAASAWPRWSRPPRPAGRATRSATSPSADALALAAAVTPGLLDQFRVGPPAAAAVPAAGVSAGGRPGQG